MGELAVAKLVLASALIGNFGVGPIGRDGDRGLVDLGQFDKVLSHRGRPTRARPIGIQIHLIIQNCL